MDLFPFQIAASTEIANRYARYADDPLMVTLHRKVPFYQNLSSITGSGKTLILADAISQIRSHLPAEPIVLWLSKGKVVVWQTYANLSSGKYADLVSGFAVKPLLDCRPDDIEHPSSGLVLVATVGKFNQKDKEEGSRKIYQLALDMADEPLWEMLKKRRDSDGKRRPFIVVYDEGHNLSNQQTELLLELDPDALIAASATMRIPEALSNTISRLKTDKEWTDSDFVATVRSSEVVQSGLVKQRILMGGYVTPMEVAIDDMLDTMRVVESAAVGLGLPFKPKAIYVSNTNVVPGSGNTDQIHGSFDQRQARPILIWRHLVENQGIDPATIAVYCDLKVDPKFPLPPTFNLFAGGENDYDKFTAGNYQHIIFNLTLQEGWDDAACYFAYIDKDMGSRAQVTQVVGRVLRQPEAKHYPVPSLNTAHFYIRTDEKSVFEAVLREVQSKIAAELPEISLTVFAGSKGASSKLSVPAKGYHELPEVSIHAAGAKPRIQAKMARMMDYRNDTVNTLGKGGRTQVLQTIGSDENAREEWVEFAHSNKVTARWVFVREVQKGYPRAINVCDIEDPRLDALVEYSSPAAYQIRQLADQVVGDYLEYSTIIQNFVQPITVPPVPVDPRNMKKFDHSVHDGYSDLNAFELEFAEALDKTQSVWFRNPSKGVFEIPLLAEGGTRNFNPDFLVWVDNRIIAIDTKGEHLIREAAARKLFDIDKTGQGADLVVRLVTRGEWSTQIEQRNQTGFTVWALKNGKPHPFWAENIGDAIQLCFDLGTVPYV